MKYELVCSDSKNYYDYRGVRFYVSHRPESLPGHTMRTERWWAYLCLWTSNTGWTADTTMDEIERALLAAHGKFEHIRKKLSIAFDDDRGQEWRKPDFYVLAGWDYQHSWNHYDPSEVQCIGDAMEAIDALIEAGMVKAPENETEEVAA